MAGSTARQIIENSAQVFNAEVAEDMDAVIQFDVTGDEVFQGYLTIKDARCSYTEGWAEQPNLTIETPADVWVRMMTGDLNPQMAFFKRLYKVKGDMRLLMKMPQIFGS